MKAGLGGIVTPCAVEEVGAVGALGVALAEGALGLLAAAAVAAAGAFLFLAGCEGRAGSVHLQSPLVLLEQSKQA